MTNFTEIDLTSWSQFTNVVASFSDRRKAFEVANGRALKEPLFRGIGNHDWKLETTLERSLDVPTPQTLISYYRRAERSKLDIESVTGRVWDIIPDYLAFKSSLQDPTSKWIDQTLGSQPEIYQYLIYLRHHGYPSPLLDWTASPFVAATFAFDAMSVNASHVAIYALFQDSIQSFGSDAHLVVVGRYLRTHPRHYLQQSRYTLFLNLQWEKHGGQIEYDYGFLPHHGLWTRATNQDLVLLIRIPASEYTAALRDLDSMNLNPYSLYGSEEALMRTISRREFLFK